MSLFASFFNGHAIPTLTETFGESVVCWEAGQERVTAVQLSTGRSFSDVMFHESESDPADDGNVGNVLKARLWLPVSAKPAPQDQWRIIRDDNTQIEFTVESYGAKSGGLMEVRLVKTTITRFKSAGKLT